MHRQRFLVARSWLAALAVLGSPAVPSAEAQVGLKSSVAQVALVARTPSRVELESAGPIRETARRGTLREAAVSLRFSTNGAYRLVVHGVGGDGRPRIWVQAADGTFHELVPGSSVTVARGRQAAGDTRQVSFRIDQPMHENAAPLPVRYELVVEPTI